MRSTPADTARVTMELRTPLRLPSWQVSTWSYPGSTGVGIPIFPAIATTVHCSSQRAPRLIPSDGARLLKALHDKEIPISRLDDMARRILTPQLAQKQNRDYPHTNFHSRDLADERHEGDRVLLNEHVDVRGDNPDFARKVAAESTV